MDIYQFKRYKFHNNTPSVDTWQAAKSTFDFLATDKYKITKITSDNIASRRIEHISKEPIFS
jgi:hypothetical protein